MTASLTDQKIVHSDHGSLGIDELGRSKTTFQEGVQNTPAGQVRTSEQDVRSSV